MYKLELKAQLLMNLHRILHNSLIGYLIYEIEKFSTEHFDGVHLSTYGRIFLFNFVNR